jgi:hypothetical protein
MSNVTIHLVIPVLILLATRLFPTKQVLLFAPFAVVPDLDTAINWGAYLFFGESVLAHRAVLHNVFVFLPTLILSVVLWRRMLQKNPHMMKWSWYAKWISFGSVRWGYASVLITFYLFSHILLDTFQGGTTLLWPLVNTYVYPQLYIFVDMGTGQITPAASVTTGEGAPTLSRRYPWMDPEQVAIWILVLMGTVAALAREAVIKRAPAMTEATLKKAPVVSVEGLPVSRRPRALVQEAETEPVEPKKRPRD